MTRAVLSLGANLGDRAGALRAALTALKDDGVLVARSTLYETPPWGPVEQPPYLNAVAVVRGDRDARGWLDRARELERAAGRTREVRWGARTLDVDVARDDGRLVLTVSDDGRGFDTAAGPSEGHFGLRGMDSLITEVGGRLDVRSAPGAGTTIRLEVDGNR